MLQDFHFLNVHRANAKHSNVDALNRKPVGRYEVDEEFGNEIQDLGGTNQEVPKAQVAKEAKTIINLFTVMELNAGNCNEEVIEKGKELVLC